MRARRSRGATDNLRQLETSMFVPSSSFPSPLSAFFAAFPLKFVCKRLCGLHCRPQAKAEKRILFIYSSVIWGRQACCTGKRHSGVFCIQHSVHRAYRGACPWQSQHSDQGHLAEARMLLVWPLLSPGQGILVQRAGAGHLVPSTSPKFISSFKNILYLSQQQLYFFSLKYWVNLENIIVTIYKKKKTLA